MNRTVFVPRTKYKTVWYCSKFLLTELTTIMAESGFVNRRQILWLVFCLFYALTLLVEALRYKPKGRGFDSWWGHWYFSLTYSFHPNDGPGVDSACNRNEYQGYLLGRKGGRCLGLTTLPLSCADCLEIWEPRPPGVLRACSALWWNSFSLGFSVPFIRQCNSSIPFSIPLLI
jgi:hypothetical protein